MKMNERIQQLVEQATSTQGPTPYNPLPFEVFDKEKFAELIVRDCLKHVNLNGSQIECEIEADIKEHFGVK